MNKNQSRVCKKRILCFFHAVNRFWQPAYSKTSPALDNITQPVHAGNQPPHNHKGGECRQQGKKNVQNSRPADAAVQLHHGGRHHAQHQQRGGGRIRNFQCTTNQNRPLVDGKELKQEVGSQNRQVEPAKEQKVGVYPQQFFPPDPLQQPQQGKGQHKAERNQFQPVGNGVQEHVYASELMKPAVHGGKPDPGPPWPDGLNIHAADGACPQDKRRGQPQR